VKPEGPQDCGTAGSLVVFGAARFSWDGVWSRNDGALPWWACYCGHGGHVYMYPPPQMCSLTSWPNKCEAKCQGFVLYKCDTRGWTATAAAAAKQQKALAIETLLRSTNRRRHAIL
jgi:hypothetical protein